MTKIFKYPFGIFLFKVNNKCTRAINVPEQYNESVQISKVSHVVLVSLLLILKRFHTFIWYFHSLLSASKYRLGTGWEKDKTRINLLKVL